MIAAQNVVVAASLGVGLFIIGFNNDTAKVVEWCAFAKLYVSCDWTCCEQAGSRPQLSSLPKSNSYGKMDTVNESPLRRVEKEYDATVTEYDLRDTEPSCRCLYKTKSVYKYCRAKVAKCSELKQGS